MSAVIKNWNLDGLTVFAKHDWLHIERVGTCACGRRVRRYCEQCGKYLCKRCLDDMPCTRKAEPK